MLKITPLTNIKQNIIQKSAQRVIQKAEDTVAISTPVIKRITNKKEAEELVYLFIDSINDTFANKSEKLKNPFVKMLHKFQKKILSMPFKLGMTSPNYIAENIKADGKLLDGYSMSIDPNNRAYISFLTIAPELKGTKKSVELLLAMGNRIAENAKANNIEYISWSANVRNKKISSLLRRFNAETEKITLGEVHYKVSLDDFQKALRL